MKSRVSRALLAIILELPPGAAGAAGWIEGVVSHVRDGDTLVMGGLAVRLWGLHAPELREAGGEDARRWMVDRALGKKLTCWRNGRLSHGRIVAVCLDAEGDLAAQLIAAGLGRDCPRFSAGRYAGYETEAAARLPLPAYCRPRLGRPDAAASNIEAE